jgi:diguanylate cyclase
MIGPVTDKPMHLPDIHPAHLYSVLEQAVDFLALLSPEGIILSVRSPRTAKLLAIEPQSLIGLPLHLFLADADALHFNEQLQQACEHQALSPFSVNMLKTDGTPVWLEGVISRISGESATSTMLLLALHDVSRWRLRLSQLDDLTGRDLLTGLANRTRLPAQILDCAGQALAVAQPFTLMVIDLDGFKQVNNSLGYSVGDKLLQQLARRLEQTLPAPDLAIRSGGGEFVILRPPAPRSIEEDAATAQKLIHTICRPYYIDGQTVRVACNIGIVRYPEQMPPGTSADIFLRNADLAISDARAHGKNTFSIFNAAMSGASLRQQAIEAALYEGISNGEFVLHYQSIHDPDGKLVGMEGLMRWLRGEGEQYSPAEFIPIAEAKGLIHLLGNWALRTACYQAARWQEEGWDGFYIAVNVSPQQFTDENFVGTVRQALQESQIAPERIVLEITEGLLMDSAGHAEQMLKELHELGVQVAVDDFGTGYSSLAYLKKFNLATLKIDKSFIDDVPEDKDNCAIINAVLGMARELGLHVVAEGVETEAQRQWLMERGCDFIQGYLFCRPMPAQQIFAQNRPPIS